MLDGALGRRREEGHLKIALGYDGSEHARRALERAARLATTEDEVIVVGVAEAVLVASRGGAHIDPAEAEQRERELEGKGIPAEARESGAELIVVGTRGRNPMERLLLGSVSATVVQRAPCDVLVVR